MARPTPGRCRCSRQVEPLTQASDQVRRLRAPSGVPPIGYPSSRALALERTSLPLWATARP
jgi:hypothetical protein